MDVGVSYHDDLNWSYVYANRSVRFPENMSGHDWQVIGTKLCAGETIWKAHG